MKIRNMLMVLSGVLLFSAALNPLLGQSDAENILIRFMNADKGEVPMGVVFGGSARSTVRRRWAAPARVRFPARAAGKCSR
ncbi:MAG: hypothetical protein WA824_07925 [Candidatus Sulfotelmatobacter sp.]